MITPGTRPDETAHTYRLEESRQGKQRPLKQRVFQGLAWLCLLLACLGSSWFAFQLFLVPQPREFTPNWQDARWVQAADTSSPVAYFRYTTNFSVPPDGAFVTIAASQVFRLYVNGVFIGSNTIDFVKGNTPQTYMYDVAATLNTGQNVIGVRVANADQGIPQLRATFGVTWGRQTSYYSTGNGWQGTGDTTLAHPRAALNDYTWSTGLFDASAWHAAQPILQNMPVASSLQVNPRLYTQLMPTHWLSAGSQQESYFVRQIDTPASINNALLRIVATGAADIFINDHLYIQWNGLVNVPQTNAVNYLTTNGQPAPYRNGLMLGIYDITPYLHAGHNIIAIHILSPGSTTARLGLESLKSAMSMDMLVSSGDTSSNPLAFDTGWHASAHPVAGWTGASTAALAWPAPETVGRPGSSHSFYMPDSNTPRNVQIIPPVLIAEVSIWSSVAILAFWLLFALVIMKRYYASRRAALAATSLIFLPALACETLLMALARENRLAQPFPYTHYWGGFLSVVVLLSALLLWRHTRGSLAQREADAGHSSSIHVYRYKRTARGQQSSEPLTRVQHITGWLLHNWALLPIMLVSIPMTLYNPAYEPYWQDELSSYYAARWIMTHGYPAFPSGFVYAKGELFSYLTALLMFIFGTPGQEGSTSFIIPRIVSMASFLISLPVLYIVGSRLFNRKVAWLATAMLAFSPYDMIWSRQARMYELAQLMVIIVLGMFYWAIKNRDKIYPVFIAVGTLVLAYFSHEEIFIILPSTVICALLGSREGRYGMPAILRKKHWWVAAVFASLILVAQLATVFLSHPMKFGSDQSQRPQIALTTNNVSYYFHLLFAPVAPKDGPSIWVSMPPFIMLDTLLALAGCVIAFCRRDRRARYCALFLLLATATLTFVFTMQADRYYYPLLPILYLMSAFAFWKILEVFWLFARRHLAQSNRRASRAFLSNMPLTTRVAVGTTVALLCASVLLTPMLPLSNFNLFLSRATGDSYHRHFADYDDSTQYLNAHKQPDDLIISVSPAIITLYYVGKVDHFFSMDRALFLIEQNKRMVETTSGSHPLLNEADFQTVLAGHQRIWLITDAGGYQGGATKNGRFVFPPADFRMVYEGYGSAVYFRSGHR